MVAGRLSKKRIAIIGGAGFIGHNMALTFSGLGADVHVVDSLQVNNLGYYLGLAHQDNRAKRYLAFIDERLSLLKSHGVTMSVVDARDYHGLSRTLSSIEPDVIVHLAAVAHANRSNKDPYSTFDHSLRTLENVLDIARFSGTHVIYFSSSMVYGNFEGQSVSEDHPCNPLGIYGALKYGAEKLVIGYSQVFGLPYTIVRPSALYGERCVSRRVGQAFIENALDGLDLEINGDGEEALDFTHVDDLTSGVALAVDNPRAIGEIFNLTFGEARSLRDLAEFVLHRFPNRKLVSNPRDQLMPERGTLSIDKARDLLGYEPRMNLEKGFNSYIDWYADFHQQNSELFGAA